MTRTERRFSPGEKLELVLRSYAIRNIRSFCRRQGIDPATLYRWRRQLSRQALAGWSSRRPGRPSARSCRTVDSLQSKLEQALERQEALQREARRWRLLARLAVGNAPGDSGLQLLLDGLPS